MATLTKTAGPGGTELIIRPAGPTTKEVRTGNGSPAAKAQEKPASDALHFRQAVERAREALAEASPVDRNIFQNKLDVSLRHRQQFWLDTCRDVREMRVASRQVLELHRVYGCRFSAASPDQVQHVLDALDSALPAWERDHPELFYQTLELNFPGLLRFRRV